MRADHTVQSSVVNAGVLVYPTFGLKMVVFVAAGASRKLVNLRARARVMADERRVAVLVVPERVYSNG